MNTDMESHPISIFKSKARTEALLKQLEQSGKPVLLTRGGKPVLVAQSATTFRVLLSALDRINAAVDNKRTDEEWRIRRSVGHIGGFANLWREGKTPFWTDVRKGRPMAIKLKDTPTIMVQDPEAYEELCAVRERMGSILSTNLAADLKPRRAKSSEDRLARFGKTQGHKD